MDRLWAPWRLGYIQGKKLKGCLFCRAFNSPKKENYVALKTRHSLSMLNLYPYNNGHLLIAPKRHIKDISQLTETEALDLFRVLSDTKSLLDKVIKPQGYNIGINLGNVAGAGIVGHLHIHIVPRWRGDTNFMSAVNNTKIVSQALDDLYKKLKNAGSKSNKRIRR